MIIIGPDLFFKLHKILNAYKNVKGNFTDDLSAAHEYGLKLKKINVC